MNAGHIVVTRLRNKATELKTSQPVMAVWLEDQARLLEAFAEVTASVERGFSTENTALRNKSRQDDEIIQRLTSEVWLLRGGKT